jgi:hypothetical protein
VPREQSRVPGSDNYPGGILLPNLAREIEEHSIFDMTSTHAAPGLLGSYLIQSEDLRTRFPFGLRNTATVH